MMTQTFRGKTLFDAKRNAFRELGEGAVIVTTRNVRKTGIAGLLGSDEFEVSATIASEPTTSLSIATPAAMRPQGPFNAQVYLNEPVKKNDEVAGLRAELRGEIRSIKGQMAKAVTASSNDDLFEEVSTLREILEEMQSALPKNDEVTSALNAAGIEGTAASLLARAVRRVDDGETSANARLREAVAELARTTEWALTVDEPTLIALVGPSGVGKTTTAAKLAAQAKLQGRSVMFVAADSFRVGAVDQLERYAELLDTDFAVATGAEDLDEILTQATADVVIVDTAGRGAPANDAVEHRLAMQVEGRRRHVLLCLSASTRAVDAERMTRAFSTARPTALVVTKLDETSSPAGIVHACACSKLSVSTLCFGQRVPEDIAQATTNALVDYVVPAESGIKK
ncbi:MAG: AAA family ATPase [Polyangiaceae bacterium]